VTFVAALVAALLSGVLVVTGLYLVHRYAKEPPPPEELAERAGLRALVRHRISPMEVSGLALGAALVAVGLAVLAFGFAAAEATRTSLWWVDAAMARWGVDHAVPWSTTALRAFTWLGSTVVVVPLALAAGLYDVRRRRRWDGLVFLLLVVIGQNLLHNAIKLIVARQRPPVHALAPESGFSFPSGHTAAATATFVAMAVLLGRGRSRRVRLALAGLAAGIATMVAATRVLLGVHWVSDVIGGAALGLVWVAVVALIFGGRRLEFAAELPEARDRPG
jgi:membrane-associated phospholipid phosphatase